MAVTNFTITDADVGRSLGIPDGYLVSLSMSQPPSAYEVPSFNEGRQCWVAGRFVLRGSRDFRDSICCDPFNDGASAKSLLSNSSRGYAGDLIVVAAPRGSQWRLSISDIPFVPPPPTWPLGFPLDIWERELLAAKR